MKRLIVLMTMFLLQTPALAQESAALANAPNDWHLQVAAIIAANDAPVGDPLTAPLIACAGTACSHHSVIALFSDEADEIRRLFNADGDAATERQELGRAIALMESFVGARNGTWADSPGNQHLDWDDPVQLDCVSEAVNTRSYLGRMALAGLLAHHRLGQLVTRYTVFLQHVAVTVIDDADTEFAVDSWVGANGEEPEIQPYGDWRLEWGV